MDDQGRDSVPRLPLPGHHSPGSTMSVAIFYGIHRSSGGANSACSPSCCVTPTPRAALVTSKAFSRGEDD